jgi:hypothetical protein
MGTEAEVTQTTEPAALVNPDGTFAADWHSRLPDDLGKEESLKPFTSVAGLAKAYRDTKKLIGGDRIPVPTEKSPPEVWDAWHAAGGRPKTADDYQVDIPEDLGDIFTKERLAEARKLAHELGVSQKQFDGYMKFEMARTAKFMQDEEAAEEAAKLAANDILKKEFGGAYDERMHVSNRLVEEAFAGKEEAKLAFLEKFGNDPDFIRFTSVVGARLVESKAMVAQLTTNTPGEAKDRITTIEAKLYSRGELPDSERESLHAELTKLYKVAHPEAQPGKTKVEAYSGIR